MQSISLFSAFRFLTGKTSFTPAAPAGCLEHERDVLDIRCRQPHSTPPEVQQAFEAALERYAQNARNLRKDFPDPDFVLGLKAQLDGIDAQALSPRDRALLTYLRADLNYAQDPDGALLEMDDAALESRHYQLSLAREGINDVVGVKRLLRNEIQKWETDLADGAKAIDPGKTWQELLQDAEIEELSPTTVLKTYQQNIGAYYRFLKANGLAELSARMPRAVLTCNPKGSVAAYSQGKLLVNIGLEEDEIRGEVLKTHPAVAIPYVSVHETAHHLHLSSKVEDPAGVPNRFLDPLADGERSVFFIEGWAAYMEKLAIDRGFYRDYLNSPLAELVAKRNMLLMSTLALQNLQLHTGETTVDAIAQHLQDNLGISRKRAVSTANRSREQGYVSAAYCLGMLQLEQLKRAVLAKHPGLILSEFHKRLLKSRPFPLPVVAGLTFDTDLPGLVQTPRPLFR